MSDENIEIPPAFFGTLSEAEMKHLFETSYLTPMATLRLWKMIKRKDPCPTTLKIWVNKADVMRLFPSDKR